MDPHQSTLCLAKQISHRLEVLYQLIQQERRPPELRNIHKFKRALTALVKLGLELCQRARALDDAGLNENTSGVVELEVQREILGYMSVIGNWFNVVWESLKVICEEAIKGQGGDDTDDSMLQSFGQLNLCEARGGDDTDSMLQSFGQLNL